MLFKISPCSHPRHLLGEAHLLGKARPTQSVHPYYNDIGDINIYQVYTLYIQYIYIYVYIYIYIHIENWNVHIYMCIVCTYIGYKWINLEKAHGSRTT